MTLQHRSPRSSRFPGLLRAPNATGINGRALPGDHLKKHVVTGNFAEHERIVLVETLLCELCLCDVTFAQLSARADDEIVNSLLRFNPLVEMFVTIQDNVDAVLHHQRLERAA